MPNFDYSLLFLFWGVLHYISIVKMIIKALHPKTFHHWGSKKNLHFSVHITACLLLYLVSSLLIKDSPSLVLSMNSDLLHVKQNFLLVEEIPNPKPQASIKCCFITSPS